MSYFNMVCDSCGREVQGITWVNGMKFCAKCYQEIYGNKNMTENLNNMYEAYLKILNEKDQRIAELEEQLKNAIVPKFEVGQEIYIVCDPNINRIVSGWKIADYEYYKQQYIVENKDSIDWIHEDKIFATKEEAEQKLAEVKGKKDE